MVDDRRPHSREELERLHTPEAVRSRLADGPNHSSLKDFVYGGIDGAVTTFAVVSGVAGAQLSSEIILILGMANLIGDGFSMAAGNYMGSRAEVQQLEQAKDQERHHIREHPEGEREEVRQIFARMGFTGRDLERAVEISTSNEERWLRLMLREEHGYSLDRPHPLRGAVVTLLAFIAIGLLPLLAFVVDYFVGVSRPFLISTILTGIAFFVVGAVKSRFVRQGWFLSGTETTLLGGTAAALAYWIGWMLRDIGG